MHKICLTIFLCSISLILVGQKKKVTVANFVATSDFDTDVSYGQNSTLFKLTVLFEDALFNSGMYEVIDKGWLGVGKDESFDIKYIDETSEKVVRKVINKLKGPNEYKKTSG